MPTVNCVIALYAGDGYYLSVFCHGRLGAVNALTTQSTHYTTSEQVQGLIKGGSIGTLGPPGESTHMVGAVINAHNGIDDLLASTYEDIFVFTPRGPQNGRWRRLWHDPALSNWRIDFLSKEQASNTL